MGVEWLTYNPFVFEHFHRVARSTAPCLVTSVRGLLPEARRVADVGSGSGAYAAEFAAAGLSASACEYSPKGRKMAMRQGISCVPFDLTLEPPADLAGPFDLAYCFEVAEHVPPELGDRLVAFLSGLAPSVLFSAAQPGQGGHGHINEQPADYWISRFAAAGMEFDTGRTKAVRESLRAGATRSWWLERNVVWLNRC